MSGEWYFHRVIEYGPDGLACAMKFIPMAMEPDFTFRVLCPLCYADTKWHNAGSPGFYSLRRTFRTVADEVPDAPAIDRIMGHATAGMGAQYVQRISKARLEAVTAHVRTWLIRK